MTLTLDKLVNDTPPAAISPKIVSQAALDMPGVKFIVQELPRISFIRSCQMILRIIAKTLAYYRIGEVDQWDQLLFDGTGRCQTALHNLFICVIDEERLRLIILSTYIILKGETSEQQVYTTLSTIAGCGERLQRLQRWM